MDYREDIIQSALEDLNSGVYSSIRATAQAYGLPRSTLQARINGATNMRVSQEHRQRLSCEQEDLLADWMIQQDAQGLAPSHARTREMATRILRANGDTRPLGQAWVTKFLKRKPQLATLIGKPIDDQKVRGAQLLDAQKESGKKRRTIAVDPTTRLTNVEMIKRGLDAAKEAEEQYRVKELDLQAQNTAKEALEAGYNACLFEFQL
ncbi:hypothetical protein PTT_07266 [Paecilomyces variotii No. 5]|uniref:HTH CENPB-type domain-containing protein n=1 Tax=Byssochlamys spectabilis (strain No. 5 / NBRC 109023) TaxID=1356009 RepID=V5FPX7_BYSSN|nr:hypothetical protein PTT_07266 [Paecilomyces variotii No. 5]